MRRGCPSSPAFGTRGATLIGCCFGVALAALVACEPSDPTPSGRGRRTFQRTCSGCHGADARGTRRPGLTKPPRDLTNPAFQAEVSDEQLRQSIRLGKGQMPNFGGLMADEQITELIAFIRSLAPPGTVPPKAVAPGTALPGTALPGAASPGTAPPATSSTGGAGAASGPASEAITARGASSP
ncbi:MAG: Cytochrome oxidase, cbb3-type, subunit [Pseudomonadota bacterium]